MAGWLLRFFENTNINEVWITLILNGLITTTFFGLSSFILKKTNYSKQGIFYSSSIGVFVGLTWLAVSGQILLFLAKGAIEGTEQGNWIFVLRLFGFSRSLIGESIYSNIMATISRLAINGVSPSPSFIWFSPSYVLGLISGLLGGLITAIALRTFQNKTTIATKFFRTILFVAGFIFTFVGFSFAIFYQAMILASG